MVDTPTNVLVEDDGEIKKRSTDHLLKDIGGYSVDFDGTNVYDPYENLLGHYDTEEEARRAVAQWKGGKY